MVGALGPLGRLGHNAWQRVRSHTVRPLRLVRAQPLVTPVMWRASFHCLIAAVLDEARRYTLRAHAQARWRSSRGAV